MTIIDQDTTVTDKSVGAEAFCPLAASGEAAALTADGAYTGDVLRIVRGTPNAEELAALVTALMLTRRAYERAQDVDEAEHAVQDDPSDQNHRPGWLREGYTAPGTWTAGP